MRRLTQLASFALLLALPLARASDLTDVLPLMGVPEESCARLEEALLAADDTGECGPLVALFGDENPLAAAFAAACALEIDRGTAMAEIRKRVTAGVRPEPLIAACATDFDPDTAEFLAGLADGQDAGQAEAARFALRVLTRREPPDGESWAAWWNANRHAIPIREPDSTAKLLRRFRSAAAKSSAGYLRDAARKFETLTETRSPASDAVAGVFSSLGEMMEKGAAFETDPRAEDGDALFARSRFGEAGALYREALEQEPEDYRTRLMLGCVLVELGDIAGAQREFERVAADAPSSAAARFLATLSARRLAHPGEGFSDAALHAWAITDRKPAGHSMPWEGDPVLESLAAQSFGGGGPMQRDPEAIARVAAESPDDAALALGCALLQPPASRGSILDALQARFPDYAPILAARLQVFGASRSNADATLALAEKWSALQPRNAYAALIRIGMTTRTGTQEPPPPLAEPQIAAIETALTLPEFDTCAAELNAARHRAREAISHPFGNTPGSDISVPLHAIFVVQALGQTAKAARERGDSALADRCAAAIARASEQLARHATTVMALECAQIAARIAEQARTGIEPPKRSAPDRSLGEAALEIVPLALLPLPSLHRTLIAEIAENELAVVKRWKTITPPSPKSFQ